MTIKPLQLSKIAYRLFVLAVGCLLLIILPGCSLNSEKSIIGKDDMALLLVPAGEFIMGSSDEFNPDDNEKPAHTVELDAFWIDQTEVTVHMYYTCVEAGVCKEPTDTSPYTFGNGDFDNYPVIHVDWNMANTYCEWVDRRLPTEAEWEKAARGADANIYPWGNKFWGDTFGDSVVNFCDTKCPYPIKNDTYDDGFPFTSPVGNYPDGASPYGALDMAGNVREWVDDSYHAYPGNTVDGSANSSYEESCRMLRGGYWGSYYSDVGSTDRSCFDPGSADFTIGFRCAMDATP